MWIINNRWKLIENIPWFLCLPWFHIFYFIFSDCFFGGEFSCHDSHHKIRQEIDLRQASFSDCASKAGSLLSVCWLNDHGKIY